jgi:hypothetical protein
VCIIISRCSEEFSIYTRTGGFVYTLIMEKKDLWAKKCPKCGHSALEHKYGKPEEEEQFPLKKLDEPRYCHHPVPSGVNDYYGFCECEIAGKDYKRVGNYALIRVSKQK